LAFVGGFLNIKGGVERFVLEVARRFIERGIEVKIFCHEYDPTKTYPEFHEIPIESINARTHFFGRFAAYFGLKNMEKLVLKADKWGADIIFLQIGYIFSDYLQKLTKKKIISYAHIQEGFVQKMKAN
jgi:glycosyltransferase involved in cell wall biosynthesis